MTASPSSERERRIAAGDREALAAWFAENRNELRRYLERNIDRRMSRRLDASDVVQLTFVEAEARLEHYATTSASTTFDAWVRQVALQTLVDQHRRHVLAQRRSVTREAPVTSQPDDGSAAGVGLFSLAGSGTSPSQSVVRHERADLLAAALERLGETDREILRLRHFQHLGNREVAEHLGIGISAASNRYVRALRHLAAELAEFSEAAAVGPDDPPPGGPSNGG